MSVHLPFAERLARNLGQAARRAAGCAVAVLALGAAVVTTACFGTINDPVRHYYTLHLQPLRAANVPRVPGLLRVRDLDAESAYDRFQIVSRRSPFELSYRQREVWAVKPNRMLSDIIARGLSEQNIFAAVSREIGERRPDYLLSGELQAIEVYDSDTQWFAHLALVLQVSHFESGAIVWAFHSDTRKPIPPNDFAHAVRALSELASEAVAAALDTMDHMRPPENLTSEAQDRAPLTEEPADRPAPAPPGAEDPQSPIVVPER